ncbi:hypothetical protein L917_00300 [Phytophthora nicotianae]|uniref:Uncharacterized protein n=1 Tax=Phytophthora nicotianae TaxID=4792 RepID=W2M174_PHYNI|nr:hypothetical protein L917_00300 [Phytophthora nicotianae]
MPAAIFSKYEEDSITDELTAMMDHLHAKDPMSLEELLIPPDENVIVDEPTDEDFCNTVVEGSPSDGHRYAEFAAGDSDDLEEDPPCRDRAEDLSVEEL